MKGARNKGGRFTWPFPSEGSFRLAGGRLRGGLARQVSPFRATPKVETFEPRETIP